MGMRPPMSIESILLNENKSYKYGTMRLQSTKTNTCGLFCLYYAYYACRGCLLENITNNFTDNLIKKRNYCCTVC